MLVRHVLQNLTGGPVRDLERIGAALVRKVAGNRDLLRREMYRQGGLFHQVRIHRTDRVEADDIRSRRRNDDRVFRKNVHEPDVPLVNALLDIGERSTDGDLIRLALSRATSYGSSVHRAPAERRHQEDGNRHFRTLG